MSAKEELMGKNNANTTTVEPESLLIEQIRPLRPQWLRFKTKRSYNVKLPTYKESQEKYGRFLNTKSNDGERQKPNK